MVLGSPRLLAKLELLPAEKMLALVDPGYSIPEVSTKLDLNFNNGSLHVTERGGDAPAGIAYSENLANIFYDSPPVKEFRRKYTLTRVGGMKPLLTALVEAYKQFTSHPAVTNGNGHHKNARPHIAFLEFRQPTRASEFELYRDYFRREGFEAEILAPEQLEYKNGKLRAGRFEIDLVYRRFSVQEFLVRFDLRHPLVQAYREHKVCVINSFRSEMAHKRALLALLTDDALTAKFPAAERKAIRENVPWTRLLASGKTTRTSESGKTDIIDLLEYVRDHRASLSLKPNDDSSDMPIYVGGEMDQASWERAIRQAQRVPYVAQERVEAERLLFPLLSYGHLEFREMKVDVHPQAFMGKVSGCSSWLSAASDGGFSTSAGIAPTFIIDAKV
jgi:hypothetical protein